MLFYNDADAEGINPNPMRLVSPWCRDFQRRGSPLTESASRCTSSISPAGRRFQRSQPRALHQAGMQIHITEMDVALPVDASGSTSIPAISNVRRGPITKCKRFVCSPQAARFSKLGIYRQIFLAGLGLPTGPGDVYRGPPVQAKTCLRRSAPGFSLCRASRTSPLL